MVQNEVSRKTLSKFLQSRRERVHPADVGLPSGSNHQTSGLRRKDIAQLIGVGETWYTDLEEGHDISVSEEVLENIARVLRLDANETRHLFMLARENGIMPESGTDSERISPAMRRLLEHQGVYPAFILGRCWDILAWNYSASLLMDNLDDIHPEERNYVWHLFMSPFIRECLIDWDYHARYTIAEFRVSYGRFSEDDRFNPLIEGLNRHSPEFHHWWSNQDAAGRSGVQKEFLHPDIGTLIFEQTTLTIGETPDLKLVIMVPLPGSDTEEKLRRLLAS